MSIIEPKYDQLRLSDEYLRDPLLLAMAWKKAHDYIRTTNWYADHFELDQSALNLAKLCEKWKEEIETKLEFSDIELVPAPKSQPWSFSKDQCSITKFDDILSMEPEKISPFCIEWQPNEPDEVKLRPLAHIPVKEQSIMTLVMMCLANEVETLQGDTSTDYEEVHKKGIVSYGNRLYCTYDNNEKADHSYGATTIYSKYFTDYRKFLQRPYHFANKELAEITPDEEVYMIELDLSQFFDLINRKKLIEKTLNIVRETQHPFAPSETEAVDRVLKAFENWEWTSKAKTKYFLCESDIVETAPKGLPQGLVASGFLSNIYMLDFDSCMQKWIGKTTTLKHRPTSETQEDTEEKAISFDVRIVDYCRYVDDMRLVISAPSRKAFGTNPVEKIKSHISDLVRKELKILGLELNPRKTKVEVFRGKSVGISRTLEEIQSKSSGPISMEDAEEQLSQLESLLVLSVNDTHEQSGVGCTLNRLALIEKNIFDIREDTLKRFAANKISRMLASKRHFTARETNAHGLPIPGDWDYLQERLAGRLIASWSHDPALVLLLKKGLELCPSPRLLEPVLEQLGYVMQKSNSSALKDQKQAAVARYCLAEIFRHSAAVIHRKDLQAIPAQADVNAYFEILQDWAASYLKNNKPNDFDILSNQAHFLLLVRMDTVLENSSGNSLQDLVFKVAKGFRTITIPAETDASSIATCILLASHLVTDLKPVLRASASLLDQGSIDHIDVLKNIAIQDTALVKELILHARPLQLYWISDTKTRRLAETLYINIRPSAKTLSEIKKPTALFKLSSRPDNPFANEIMSLKLIRALLDKELLDDDWKNLKPEDVIDLSRTTVTFEGYFVPPRFEDIDKPLKIKKLAFCPSIAATTAHLRVEHIETRILQRVALCLRAILAGSTDPTGFGQQHTPRAGYRGLKSTQFKRQFGLITTPESLAGEGAQFSGWLTTLLAKLLRWPGVHVNDQGYEWPNQELTVENVSKLVKERLEKLKNNYCQLSGMPGLTELVTPSWDKGKTSLTVAMVQSKLPFKKDFETHGIYLNDSEYRVKHRRHIARVSQLVVNHIESQHLERPKQGQREQNIDLIIWPELAVHKDDVDILVQLSQKTHAIILAGLGFIDHPGIKGPSNCAIWIVPRKHNGNQNEIKRLQGKHHMMKDEASVGIRPWRPYQLMLELKHPAYLQETGFTITGSICYDATDISLSADLRNKSNAYLVPALNQDVNSFDTMVDALHYHMYQPVILVNTGEFGSSYAKAPYKEPHKRLIAHSSGNNQVAINTFEMNMFDFRRDMIGKSMQSGVEQKTAPAGVEKS
ncbi:Reverse transcriptase (RNA-dependent DNA polymerase) [Chromohalobacter canadensis]|uniref:Reverse transcriptase (RNA-dependent DNA polymerase) n=1 Tax=Chromohalobacter canadensis TaxID=141389 RepID=A0A285VPV7_9GAMM|nr:RNA-directed DNA polymerase [Chromohalobacter canadensis]SOC54641.1 Reverse transcriptase (RNA-dependent DNA polymerase) [Chromohalobacter canadensis]